MWEITVTGNYGDTCTVPEQIPLRHAEQTSSSSSPNKRLLVILNERPHVILNLFQDNEQPSHVTLKQVQDDERGHEESVLELREPRRQCPKLLLSMASHRARPRKLSTTNPRNTPLYFVRENMLDKVEQIVNKGSNADHTGPA
jgi:hypothetical protein